MTYGREQYRTGDPGGVKKVTYKELRTRRRAPLYPHVPTLDQEKWKDFVIDSLEIAADIIGLRKTLDNHNEQEKEQIRDLINRQEKALSTHTLNLFIKMRLVK